MDIEEVTEKYEYMEIQIKLIYSCYIENELTIG